MLTRHLIAAGIVSALGATVAAPVPAEAVVVDGDIEEEEYTRAQFPIARGARGATVRDFQLYLQEEGYYNGPIDGIYGPQTERAVTLYQQDNEILTSGNITYATYEEMSEGFDIDIENPEAIDDGLFDRDGVFDGERERDGVFDGEGQFDGEGDGIL